MTERTLAIRTEERRVASVAPRQWPGFSTFEPFFGDDDACEVFAVAVPEIVHATNVRPFVLDEMALSIPRADDP